jgi:hypothetical protein
VQHHAAGNVLGSGAGNIPCLNEHTGYAKISTLYQSTCITSPLEFAKQSGLKLALTVIVSIERLEYLVEMLV